jgi:glycosyltransferase involved in cell wall biosynthesis
VSGGTELFSRLVKKNFDTVVFDIPWQTTPAENRKYITQMKNLVEEHKIDLILSNNIKAVCFYALRNIGVPILHITHTNYGLFTANETLAKMISLGHSVFSVSQYNKMYFDNRAERLNQPKVNFAGVLNPAYCQHDIPVNTNPEKTLITVGRSNSYKHPFVIHKMVKDTEYTAEVITSVGVDENSILYYEKNKHLPHKLKLPHNEVIDRLSNSTASVITCINETFGITALESLSVGTPVIIRADVTGNHASSEIAAHESHRILIRKSNETKSAIDSLIQIDRNEIKQMTQEKHNKNKWVTDYQNAFDKTIQTYKKSSNHNMYIKEFFTF